MSCEYLLGLLKTLNEYSGSTVSTVRKELNIGGFHHPFIMSQLQQGHVSLPFSLGTATFNLVKFSFATSLTLTDLRTQWNHLTHHDLAVVFATDGFGSQHGGGRGWVMKVMQGSRLLVRRL